MTSKAPRRPWTIRRSRTMVKVLISLLSVNTEIGRQKNLLSLSRGLCFGFPLAAHQLLNARPQLHDFDQRLRRQAQHLVAPCTDGFHQLQRLAYALLRAGIFARE